jgi:hypothetical protein
MHPHLDLLNWPVLGVSFALWPWLGDLWAHMPTPTAVYMGVSASFMLFQMSDKLGLLERFKRGRKDANATEIGQGCQK